jgi:hypothetical protein
MKCKIFVGIWYEAQDAFNQWAKGKALTRDVLIHTICIGKENIYTDGRIAIIVYHPEDPYWDETPKQLTVPIHDVPVPHIKVEEIKVTQ